MATRFEVVLHGSDPVALRAAGEEALDEIERLDAQLSFYNPRSDISRINALAARQPVRVDPLVFGLLEHAARLSAETQGAFDPTVGPLMQCWGFTTSTGALPDPGQLEAARLCVGIHLVELDAARHSVRFTRPDVRLDLGSIGKGFALDRAREFLLDAGIESALIHGGTSTVHAIGRPPDAPAWKVAVQSPSVGPHAPWVGPSLGPTAAGLSDPPPTLATVALDNESLSVSGVHGKAFEVDGRRYGHVIDPRLGEPVAGALLAAVTLPSATETDALSTALLVLGDSAPPLLTQLRPAARWMIALRDDNAQGLAVHAHGDWQSR